MPMYIKGYSKRLKKVFYLTKNAFSYIVQDKEAGEFTVNELGDIIMPQLIDKDGGDENLLVRRIKGCLYVTYRSCEFDYNLRERHFRN